MLTTHEFERLCCWCEDQELTAVWGWVSNLERAFSRARDSFLWALRRLLEERRIELVNMHTHEPLTGSIEEQVQRFSDAFPKNEAEMNNGIWFFTEACPGGAVWRLPR